MNKTTLVYDGKEADNMTIEELIIALLRDQEVVFDEGIINAMNEAFRCGFLRGEEYGWNRMGVTQ